MFNKIQVNTSTLVLACIMLSGILLIIYALIDNDSFLIKLGVCIGLIFSQAILWQNMLARKESKKKLSN